MKKGYDDVLQAGSLSSRLREGVNTLVNEVRSLNRSYAKDGGESTHSSQREVNEQSDQVRISVLPNIYLISFKVLAN